MQARALRGVVMPVLAALAFASPARPLRAQQSDSTFTDIVLRLTIDLGPERTVVAFTRDSVVFLPLRQVLEMAELRVVEALAGRRISGLLEPGNVPFWFDTELGTRGRRGLTGALAPGDAVWRADELYVAAPLLLEVLGVRMRMDWFELQLSLTDAETLPVRRRMEREARRASRMTRSEGGATRLPLERLPEPVVDGAVLDYSLAFALRRPQDNVTLQTGFGAALMGGRLAYQATSQAMPGGGTYSARTTWERAWPERRVVRQLRAGDAVIEGARVRAVRGAVVTNAPFLRHSAFMTDAFTGRFGAGWQVELYSAEELVSFAEADSSGRYHLPVPLAYGPNPVQLRAFGPNGEIVRIDRAFQVPFERLPARRFEYVLGGGQCAGDPCRSLLLADARYGLSRRVTVRGGAEAFRRDGTPDAWYPYAAGAASLAPSVLATFEAMLGGATRSRFVFNPTPDLRAEAGHAWLGPTGGRVFFGGGVDRTRSDGALFWRPGGGRLQLQGGLLHGEGMTPHTTWNAGPSIRVASATVNLVVKQDVRRSMGTATATSGVDASFIGLVSRAIPVLGMSLLTASVRTSCAAELLRCDPRPSDWRAALSRQVGDAVRLDLALSGQRVPSRTVFELAVTTALPFLRAITRTGYSDDIDYPHSQVLEGSLMWDRHAGRVRFDDGRSVGFAGVRGVVFHDRNGNGVQDLLETGVPEVLVRVGSRGVMTDSLGRFASFDLLPFEPAVVEVDTLGLTDPTWVPAAGAIAVRPSPNGYRFVGLALVEGRELSGQVTLDGRELGQVQVLAYHLESGRTLTLTTYADGTFYAPAVRPGTYELTLQRELLERLRAFFAPVRVVITRDDRAPAPVRLQLTGP